MGGTNRIEKGRKKEIERKGERSKRKRDEMRIWGKDKTKRKDCEIEKGKRKEKEREREGKTTRERKKRREKMRAKVKTGNIERLNNPTLFIHTTENAN